MCESVTRGQTSPTEQLDGDRTGRGCESDSSEGKRTLDGHFMVQETQSGFFPARIGSVTRKCQRSPVHEIRYCQIYSEFLRVWTNKPMCLWSKQTDRIFPGVVSHIFSHANQDILCASKRDRFFFLHLKKGKIFSAPIKMLRNAADLIRILLLSVFIRKCCLFLSFGAGLF